MPFSVRRVVTGDNAQGKAVILSDETKEAFQRSGGGTAVRQLWMTETTPDPFNGKDITDRIKGTNPPLTGSHFRIIEFPPQAGTRSRHERSRGAQARPRDARDRWASKSGRWAPIARPACTARTRSTTP